MIVLDSNALIALVRVKDVHHNDAIQIARNSRPPLVVPAGILSEVAYMMENWADSGAVPQFLDDLASARFEFDCGENDFWRIRDLVQRYDNLPLGFADASVIACAERLRAPVLTFDQQHFPVVAREGTFRIASSPDAS